MWEHWDEVKAGLQRFVIGDWLGEGAVQLVIPLTKEKEEAKKKPKKKIQTLAWPGLAAST